MKKDFPRLERAFTEAPSYLSTEIERTFKRGEAEMNRRHKLVVALTAMAACAILMAGLAFATGQMTRPKPDRVVTEQGGHGALEADENILPEITPEPTPTPEVTPIPTATPEVTPEPTPTPEVTPEPTPMSTPETEVNLVYTQPKGNYYHSDPNCSGMVGAVPWTEESAISVGKQPCPVCILGTATLEEAPEEAATAETVEVPVYYTPKGIYFHGNDQCSGMANAEAHSLAEAEAAGKQRCPVCQPVEPDHYDLFKQAFGQGLEALVPGSCYGYCGEETHFFGGDSWFVTDGETYSMVCHVENILKADGGVSSINSYFGNPLEDVFCISFYSRNIGKDNLWSFLSGTEVGATAFREKDEAVEHLIEESGIDKPLNLEEGNVWVAIGSDGVIKELEVYYVDADSDVTVTLAWTLTDGEYVFMGTVG